MEILIKASQLILSLSILVILHELGHFIPAKLFKTRVEKFYLFFDPWFSLFKFKKGDTEYGIGWLPLGGYVKISGMIDESMDKEQMNKEPESWEFRSKPAWQRLIIMLGGVTVNIILGFLIYSLVLFAWGKEYLPVQNAKYGVICDSLMHQYGFQDGDKILAVGDSYIETFSDIPKAIILDKQRNIQIERNGEEMMVSLPNNMDEILLDNNVKVLFSPLLPFVIDTVLAGAPAADSDLKKEDRIIGINDVATPYFQSFVSEIGKYKGEAVAIVVNRGGEDVKVQVNVGEDGKIGVGNKSIEHFFEINRQEYGFFEAFPAGIEHGINVLSGYVESIKFIFTAAGAKQMGGFGAIGSLFSPVWDWHNFWNMTAFISIMLAFMNVLPIPALDGGHVVFLLYEIVTRRKPNEKVLEYAQITGMVILFALFVFANGNDLFKLFSK